LIITGKSGKKNSYAFSNSEPKARSEKTMKTPCIADTMACHVVIIIFFALCILGIGSKYLWTGNLNTTAVGHTMNDQVGYITAARNLADTGKLESSLYYPALVNYYKSHNLLYMPGNYYIRAFFFSIFGYSIFTAFLPNILAFIGSAVLVFIIAERIFTRETAYMSSICFMLFPPVILYAYSAMMEILFVFFSLLSVFIFLKLPHKISFATGGATIALSYIIRESALLMLPGFAIMIYLGNTDKRAAKTLLFALTSLLLIFIVKKIPVISDIPPHFSLSLININGLYVDAFAVNNTHLSPVAMLSILLSNVVQNLGSFRATLYSWESWPAGFTFYTMILVLSVVSMFVVLLNRKINRAFAYFTITTVSILTAITFSVRMYFMNSGIRQILFMVPFLLCIVFYAFLTSEISKRRGLTLSLLSCILIACIFLFVTSLNNFRNDFMQANAYDQKCGAFLDSVGVSNVHFLVAPHDISLDYVNSHYPIKWSFIPGNEKTLKLLSDKFPVDMLIIPAGHNLVYDIKSNAIRTALLDGKFIMTNASFFIDQMYIIYRPVNTRALIINRDREYM
jgi:4-amino-4-deoxy-L-arabinose transferase-like glycosyltransferase